MGGQRQEETAEQRGPADLLQSNSGRWLRSSLTAGEGQHLQPISTLERCIFFLPCVVPVITADCQLQTLSQYANHMKKKKKKLESLRSSRLADIHFLNNRNLVYLLYEKQSTAKTRILYFCLIIVSFTYLCIYLGLVSFYTHI